MDKKRTRGGQKENQNAVGKHTSKGRKEYYPVHFWGKRWPVEVGKAIKAHLDSTGATQSAQVTEWVNLYVLKESSGKGDV